MTANPLFADFARLTLEQAASDVALEFNDTVWEEHVLHIGLGDNLKLSVEFLTPVEVVFFANDEEERPTGRRGV